MTRHHALLAVLLMAAATGVATGVRADANANSSRVSALVYPPRGGALRISHTTPAHAQLPCVSCHANASHSTQAADDLSPPETACQSCHAQRMDRSHPQGQTCGYCHADFDATRPLALGARGAPRARIAFSHARHTAATCELCHVADAAGQRALPSMSECMACHTGKQTLGCTGCHATAPGGLVQTRFPEGKLVPRSAFLGMAHGGDFLVRHRWLAADEGNACSSCHTEKDCSDCHMGDRRPARIHPNDYLALHAQDSRRNQTRCTSCHTTQSFCLPCHARLGVSDVAAPDLLSPRRFHPPTSVWARGPVQHAREAQRSLGSCTSCHVERDCVQCHGGKGIGAGLSPHPPGFNAECGRRLAQNARPCVVCHGSLEQLRSRCR